MINDLVYGSVTIEASTLTILVEHIEKSHLAFAKHSHGHQLDHQLDQYNHQLDH